MNYQKLDFVIGLSIQFSYFPLMVFSNSWWLLPVTIIIGMNLTMGNWRHLYNKLRKKQTQPKEGTEQK